MNHAKRFLAILLAVILTVGVAVPAAPQLVTLGETLGTALKAEAADPKPLSSQTDTFDMEAEILSAKKVKNVSASDPQLHNWQYVSDYETLKKVMEKEEVAYIRLTADIYKKQDSDSQNRTIEGAGKIFDHCIVVKCNMVLDLNGHTLDVEDYKNKHHGALFYVIKPDTTLILLDSSTDGTGKILYHSDIAGPGYKFTTASVTDLFFVQDATVYVLGGSYKAGLTKLQDIYDTWEKFVGIGGALLKGALSIGSQALDIYTSIQSGGALGSTGVLSNLKNVFNIDSNDALGMMTNMVSKLAGDGGQTAAQAPQITAPLAGQGNVEPEVDDLNGRTANTSAGLSTEAAAAEASQGTADTEASGGSGSSVTMDSLGIYIKTNSKTTNVYKEMKLTSASILQKDVFRRGDEIDVLSEEAVSGNTDQKWFKIKYKDQEAYVLSEGFVRVDQISSLINNTSTILENGLKSSIQDHGRELLNDLAEKIGAPAGTVGMVEQTANVLTNAVKGVVNACKKYTEQWYQVHWGTCFDLRGDAQLVILDGNFAGHGMGVIERKDIEENGVTKKWVDGECDIRDEVIDCSTGGEVWIMGGSFYGMAGANIFNVGALTDVANKTKVHVRGGYFNCSSVNRMRGLQPDNKDKSVTIAGVKGFINLPIEAYSKDLIKDGRIQLCEATGTGNLVVKNRSINQNEITYSLYCAEDELLHLSDLVVSPNESKYMAKTFQLIGHSSQDHVLEGSHYINFTIGDMTQEHAYVAPRVNSKDLRQVVGANANEQQIEAAILDSDAWYYKYPRTDFLKNLRMDDRQSSTSAGKQYNYISDVRVYTYTLHELDPVTQEELGAPLAVKTVPSSKILTGQLYLSPVEAQYSNGNEFYLYDGWKPGGMYKVTMAVDEILDVGSPNKAKRDEFGKSTRIASCGTTSLLIRCWDAADEEYTPIRFSKEDLKTLDTAKVTFLNAQVGRVDIYGQKLFTVQYNWRIAGKVDGKDFDVPVVTSTRKQQGITDPIPIEGNIYDDWEYQHNYHRNFLTQFNSNGVATSVKPYWGGSDTLIIPATVSVNGEEISTVGKQLYCKVTYGLCYYRWAKAIKTLPIIEFPPVQDAAHASDNAASDVRQTVEQCTYETKRITIKSGNPQETQEPAVIDQTNGHPDLDINPVKNIYYNKNDTEYFSNFWIIPDFDSYWNKAVSECNASTPYDTATKNAIEENKYTLMYSYTTKEENAARAKAAELSQGGKMIPIMRAEANIKVLRAATNEWEFAKKKNGDVYDLNKQGETLADIISKGRTSNNLAESVFVVSVTTKSYYYKNGNIVKTNDTEWRWMQPMQLIPVDSMGNFGSTLLAKNERTPAGFISGNGWQYDDTKKTLTLQNYNGTPGGLKDTDDNWNMLFTPDTDLTIELIGENRIELIGDINEKGHYNMIRAKTVTFTGSGNLTLDLKLYGSYQYFCVEYYTSFVKARSVTFNQTGTIAFNLRNVLSWGNYGQLNAYFDTNNLVINSGTLAFYTDKLPTMATPVAPPFWGRLHIVRSLGDVSNAELTVTFKTTENSNLEVSVGDSAEKADLLPMTADEIKDWIKKTNIETRYVEIKWNSHQHVWSGPEIVTRATADKGGRIKYHCLNCDVTTEIDTVPFAISATANSNKKDGKTVVVLKCSTHIEAEKYEFYRYNRVTDDWDLLYSGEKNQFTDMDVSNSNSYDYKIKMIRSEGEPKEATAIRYCYVNPENSTVGYCNVNVENGYADKNFPKVKETVTITARNAPAGKTFDKWIVETEGVTLANPESATTTFVMVDRSVSIIATYKDLPAGIYSVTVTGGTASVSSAKKGDTVTVTAAAAPAGQTFDKWVVVKGGVTLANASNATTTFVMGDADVEVKATYKAAGSTEPEFMLGDVDGSGKVDTADARFALRRAIDLEKYAADSREYKACDVDKNGKVETRDARFILRHAIGLKDPEITW